MYLKYLALSLSLIGILLQFWLAKAESEEKQNRIDEQQQEHLESAESHDLEQDSDEEV
ncbi:MAG: hypothetical protein AAFQ80_19860 [Cyanobacteria bacterium J06621_8]